LSSANLPIRGRLLNFNGQEGKMTDLEANKAIVREFFAGHDTHDINRLEAVLHKDFIWNTAIQDDGAPNELRPLQSKLLRGRNLPHPRPRLTRQEAVALWGNSFNGEVGKVSIDEIRDDHVVSEGSTMSLQILGITAEGDRVAVEYKANGLINPTNMHT